MKKIISICIGLITLFSSCSSNNDEATPKTTITINFKNYWDDTEILATDLNQFKFTTENEQTISIERLRYLISNIQLTDAYDNVHTLSTYNLVNFDEQTGLSFSSDIITFNGNQTLTFTFGFSEENNTNNAYEDLNTANFNLSETLGGGYYFMQFDGKYKDKNNEEQPFNYNVISAINLDNNGVITKEDTSFSVSLSDVQVKNNVATINIKADISNWFTNNWDLNTWNTELLTNYNAQKQMQTNGEKVFSLLE